MREKIIGFVKRETVMVAAAVLAILSAFIIRPSADYVKYIDFRVLGILLSLMIVMAGFQENGLFDQIANKLLKRTKTTRELCLVLVLLCYFFGMLITNDVALITFVPFAMLILRTCRKEELLIPVIVMQTIAANLGSMLMPVGNPQNLYLYNLGGFSLIGFVKIMFPYAMIALAAIIVCVFVICRKNELIVLEGTLLQEDRTPGERNRGFRNIVYMILFVLSLLVVVKILPYYAVLIFVVAVTFVMDRSVLGKVDYSLLFTFSFFFIFTGNIGQMEAAREWLQSAVEGRTVILGAAVSQVISNVPATLLLSGFTSDYEGLMIGANIGGLGTLIASMASLISYKIYTHKYDQNKGKYFRYFTAANICFLVLLLGAAAVLR